MTLLPNLYLPANRTSFMKAIPRPKLEMDEQMHEIELGIAHNTKEIGCDTGELQRSIDVQIEVTVDRTNPQQNRHVYQTWE